MIKTSIFSINYSFFSILLSFFILQIAHKSHGQIDVDFLFSPNNACSGTVISFTNQTTGSGSITYLWEFGDGNTSAQTNPSHTYIAGVGNGSQNFFVRLTAFQGDNEQTVTKTVSVLRPPSTSLTDPDNWPSFSKCTGTGDFVLNLVNNSTTNNTNYAIDWGDGSAPFSSNDFQIVSHTYTSQGLYDLVFNVTGENSCVNSETYPVLYGANPALGITGPEGSVGCAPISLTYEITGVSANIGTEYTFTFDDGSESYDFNQENVPTSITHQFTEASCGGSNDFFKLTARAVNQCGYQQLIVEPIAIDREPQAIITALDTVCMGDLVTFHNNSLPPCGGNPTLTNYTWFIDGNEYDVGNSTASQTYTFNTPGNHAISLRATNTTVSHCNGGVNEVQFSLLVVDSEIPAAPVVSGPEQICQGEQDVSFIATTVAHADEYIWSLPEGAEIVSGDGSNSIVVNFTETIETGEIEFTVRGANVCNLGEESEAFLITVSPLPGSAGPISGLSTICQGQEIVLTYEVATIPYAESYIWTVPENSQIVSGFDSNVIDVLYSENAISGAIATQGINSCGLGNESTINIQVAPIPDDAGEISGPDEICSGEMTTFKVEAIQYSTWYVWQKNGNEIMTSESDSINILFEEHGDFIVSVYGENDCGSGAPKSKQVTVHAGPDPNMNPQNHCFGHVAVFTNPDIEPDTNIESWYWDFGDGYSSTLAEPVHVYSSIGEFVVRLDVASIEGCSATMFDTIAVHDIPISRFRAVPDTVFVGQPIQFIDDSYLLNDTLLFAKSWFYDFGDTTYAEVQNPLKTYSHPGKYNVMQEVDIDIDDDIEGCPDRSYLDVLVLLDVFIPNVFTPGGGGGGGKEVLTFGPMLGGDIFIPGMDEKDFVLEFSIFNRWGERVFYDKGPEPRWDGTIRGGPIAPTGIYVWRLIYNDIQGKQVVKAGNVLLLK